MEGFMEEWTTNGNKPEMWRCEGLEFQQAHREGSEDDQCGWRAGGDGEDKFLKMLGTDHLGPHGLGEGVCFWFQWQWEIGLGGERGTIYSMRRELQEGMNRNREDQTGGHCGNLGKQWWWFRESCCWETEIHGWIWIIWSITLKLLMH